MLMVRPTTAAIIADLQRTISSRLIHPNRVENFPNNSNSSGTKLSLVEEKHKSTQVLYTTQQ
jgi:hypothetical protein